MKRNTSPPNPHDFKPGEATVITEFYLREAREERTSLLKGMLALNRCPEELHHLGPAKVIQNLRELIAWSEAQTLKLAAAARGQGGPFLIAPGSTVQKNRFQGQPIEWEDPEKED